VCETCVSFLLLYQAERIQFEVVRKVFCCCGNFSVTDEDPMMWFVCCCFSPLLACHCLSSVAGASICSFLIHRSFVGVDDDRFRDISRHLFNKTKFQKFKMALSFISILEHHLRFNQSRSLSLASHLATTRRNAMHFLQTATAHTFSLLILLRCCIN
jgi:hypothetical protein